MLYLKESTHTHIQPFIVGRCSFSLDIVRCLPHLHTQTVVDLQTSGLRIKHSVTIGEGNSPSWLSGLHNTGREGMRRGREGKRRKKRRSEEWRDRPRREDGKREGGKNEERGEGKENVLYYTNYCMCTCQGFCFRQLFKGGTTSFQMGANSPPPPPPQKKPCILYTCT